MKKVVLATDLGGTNLRIAAVNTDGEILSRVKNRTPKSNNPIEIVRAMEKSANECQAVLEDCEIVAFAAAVPGIIDFDRGLIIKSPNLPETDGFELISALESELRLKAIIENDANAAVVGENWLGASKGSRNTIMVTLGTGVGGGIIVNGEVLRGIDGTAGEIGHINVEHNGHSCGCGSIGCLEQYASATAVVRMAKELSCDSTIIENDDLTSKDIYQMALDGIDFAEEVFRKQGYYLGIMLAGLINTLNPEIIVIGGGAADGWDLFVPQLKMQIKKMSYNQPADRVRIKRAKRGDDAGILGAAKLAFAKVS